MAQAPVEIPRLQTARLHLEPMGFQHTQGMFALWSSPEVCEYSGAVSDYERNLLPMPAGSPEVSDKIIDFWVRAAVDGWGFRWAILRADNAEFIGALGFNALGACSELAYHLHPSAWGQGFMSEACKAAVAWVEQSYGCAQIEAFIHPDNLGSIALAERLGLSPDGSRSEGALRYLS